jgi:hypothetical protein
VGKDPTGIERSVVKTDPLAVLPANDSFTKPHLTPTNIHNSPFQTTTSIGIKIQSHAAMLSAI